MRLIDADELRKLFKEEYKRTKQMINDGQTHLDTLAEGYTEAYHIVRYKALTVDAVPVVRCQECAFSVPIDRNCELNTSIYLHCNEHHGEEIKNVWHKYKKYYKDYSLVSRDDFCSYGKRRKPDGKE